MPHTLEFSHKGYNAFVTVYRQGVQTACEDLSWAIAYVQDHADELGVSMDGYSICGGSAGARMADWIGSEGTSASINENCPRLVAIVMQYTGLSEVTGEKLPTYSNIGTADGITNWRVMSDRCDELNARGIPAQIEVFYGLYHSLGLGIGTVAEGWLDHTVSFWEDQV